jgi:hypothetical protein
MQHFAMSSDVSVHWTYHSSQEATVAVKVCDGNASACAVFGQRRRYRNAKTKTDNLANCVHRELRYLLALLMDDD